MISQWLVHCNSLFLHGRRHGHAHARTHSHTLHTHASGDLLAVLIVSTRARVPSPPVSTRAAENSRAAHPPAAVNLHPYVMMGHS
jgi:hypothetical protein